MRRAGLGVLVALAPLTLGACQSTADKSARIAREAGAAAQHPQRAVHGPRNRTVRVRRAVVVRGVGGAAAVAVEVRNAGDVPQANVPVVIDVRDGHGASIYRNDAAGLQPSLQRLGLIGAHRTAWWVNDQVLGSAPARTVVARVDSAGAARADPSVEVGRTRLEGDAGARSLSGTIVNRSGRAQHDVAVYVVALRGPRVVAAGRGLVRTLPATGRAPFTVFFIGDPAHGRIAVTVAPTP